MQKRAKLAIAAGAALLLTALLIAALPAREPTYQGLTMGQWLQRHNANAEDALVILGTNNLPLLLNRVAYDPDKDLVSGLLFRLYRLTRSPRIRDLATHRVSLAEEAHGVFYRLGSRAAPAIPQLARIAEHGGTHASFRAMNMLLHLGDEGVAVVASRAANGRAETRLYAVQLLTSHSQSTVARSALTNALSDPDFRVRNTALHAFTSEWR
jgi:hypothetical protein